MNYRETDTETALSRTKRKIERLEHSLRIHRIGMEVCVLIIVGLLALIGFSKRQHYARAIMIDDEICCLVATQKDAEAVRQRIIAAAKSGLPHEAFIEQKWEDAAMLVDERPVLSVDEAVALLEDKVTVLVEAATINVNGQNVVAIASKELAEKALDTLKSRYIGPEGATAISQRFAEDISISTSAERPCDISTDIRDTVSKLTRAHREPKQYTIQPGDFPEAIAKKHGMRVNELYQLNPGLKGRTIYPGEKLKVGNMVPPITVVTVVEVTKEQTIEPPVKKDSSSSLPRGQERVTSAGKPGNKKISQKTIKETVIEEAEPKCVLIGTGDAG